LPGLVRPEHSQISNRRLARREEKSWLDFKDRAQPDSKRRVYEKAEPFLTTGGRAVPNDDGLLLCCAVTPWGNFVSPISP